MKETATYHIPFTKTELVYSHSLDDTAHFKLIGENTRRFILHDGLVVFSTEYAETFEEVKDDYPFPNDPEPPLENIDL